MEDTKPKHAGGRPTKYEGQITIDKAKEYLNTCVDEYSEFNKTRGENTNSYDRLVKVNLPTVVGLALFLDVNKDTVYEWAKEYPEFSDTLSKVVSLQEQRLLENGMSGDYNSTIAKLILSSNHGYREKSDITSDGKALSLTFDNQLDD